MCRVLLREKTKGGWGHLPPPPATFVSQKYFTKLIFASTVKIAISFMYRRKNLQIKYLPMRAGGEIGENFLLAKISSYIIVLYSPQILWYMKELLQQPNELHLR